MYNEKPEGREIKENRKTRETGTCGDRARHTRWLAHHMTTRRERRCVWDSGAREKERVRVSCSGDPVVAEDVWAQVYGDLRG